MNNPIAALVVAIGLSWLVAIIERLVGWIDWSWWIVMSPPLVLVGLFLLYVVACLGVNLFWIFAAWSVERRAIRDREAADRRMADYYKKGLHHIDDFKRGRPWNDRWPH